MPVIGPHNRSLPFVEWPEGDREAWSLALQPADLLDPQGGVAARWRPSTHKLIQAGYGRWLGWLIHTDQLDLACRPGARATRQRVSAYLEMLKVQNLADYTKAGRLQNLGDALRAMEPQDDWGWILRGASRIHGRAVPAKDISARLRPVEDIVALGLDLMHAADNDRFRTDYERAVLFRDGLLVAFLAYAPLRISNLAGITLDRHLQKRGDERWVVFPGPEMKNGRPLEYPWPSQLAEALERYIAVHRANMLDEKVKASGVNVLWVSRNGTSMKSGALGYRIFHRTEVEFGTGINPHAFRHLAATTIANDDPESITDAARVLGHARLETTEKHYNLAKMERAGRAYHADVVASRKRR